MVTKKGKILRKVLLVLSLLWSVLLVMALVYSKNFEYNIMMLLKKSLDKKINTEIILQRDAIHFSLFRKFPSASLRLENALVLSPETSNSFPDTLLYAEVLSVKLNLIDIINHRLKVNEMEVEKGIINLAIDKQENENYQIWNSSDGKEQNDSVGFAIESLVLTNTTIHYTDAGTKMNSLLFVTKAQATGEFEKDRFAITLKTKGTLKQFEIDNSSILANQHIVADFQLEREEKALLFKKGNLSLSGFKADFKGNFDLTEAKGFKFTIEGQDVNLQKIHSGALDNYFEKTQLDVERGTASVFMTFMRKDNKHNTSVSSRFSISDLKVNYPEKAIRLEKATLKGNYSNGIYRNIRSSQIVIDTLHAQLEGEPVQLKLNLRDFKYPQLDAQLSGRINDKTIQKFIADSLATEIKGSIQFQFISEGRITGNKKSFTENLLQLNHSGRISLTDFSYTSPDINRVNLNGEIAVEKNTARINELRLKANNTNVTTKGSIENWKSIIMENGSPNYSLIVQGDKLDVSDFSTTSVAEEPTATLPDRLHFQLNCKLKTLVLSNTTLRNVSGSISYKPYLMQFHSINFQAFEGSISSSGSLAQVNENLHLTVDFLPKQISVREVFQTFSNFKQENIKAENIMGHLSGKISCSMQFDKKGEIVLPRLKVYSLVQLENGELINYKPLEALSAFIDLDELKHIKFSNLNTHLIIENNNMQIDKTVIQSNAVDFSVYGQHNFSDEYVYHFQVVLSDILWKKAKKQRAQNSEFGYVVEDSDSRTTIPLVLTGKGEVINVKYDKKESKRNIRQSLKSERKEWQQILQKEEKPVEMKVAFEEEEVQPDKEKEEEQPLRTEIKAEENSSEEEEEESEFIIHWEDE